MPASQYSRLLRTLERSVQCAVKFAYRMLPYRKCAANCAGQPDVKSALVNDQGWFTPPRELG